ncbi:hypothetical protein K474DRAFT_1109495 [Panus rudis PR-1116 ss-1]|nr:hypothetical protein K474DRAFT_1109495 [Panus rudis PR-1116 ss-1]
MNDTSRRLCISIQHGAGSDEPESTTQIQGWTLGCPSRPRRWYEMSARFSHSPQGIQGSSGNFGLSGIVDGYSPGLLDVINVSQWATP